MANIFEKSLRENFVFRDERCLYPEFIPSRLLHREKETESIASAFNPLLSGKNPLNVFLSGPTGVGKTTVAHFVLRELEEFSDRVKSFYLNCFEFNSRHAVLSGIANFLGVPSPRRGIATDEIYRSLLEGLRKSVFSPVIVLDEVDQLFLNSDGQKLLYDLLRVVEFEKNVLGLVLISNSSSLMLSLDERIRSSLAVEKIVFEPYSVLHLKEILTERADAAFLPKAFDFQAIAFIAAKCARLGGDCRIGVSALLKAGRLAEKQNSSSVLLSHAKEAFKSVEGFSALKGLKYLSEHETFLVSLLCKKQELTSGQIFENFSDSFPKKLSQRRVRDLLNELEKKGIVLSKRIELGNKGKTRSFKCILPKDHVLKALGK